MTEPSDAAKRKACELANQIDDTGLTVADWMREYAQGPFLALALYIDEVGRVARAIEGRWNPIDPRNRTLLRSLMLPDPPDPDEELAREVEKGFAVITRDTAYDAALATIKRLREQGRLTDAE